MSVGLALLYGYLFGIPVTGMILVKKVPYEMWSALQGTMGQLVSRKMYRFCLSLVALLWPASLVVVLVMQNAHKFNFNDEEEP